ncbi:hypothetical protein BDY21DRAFT_343138 [Lineolata rhizophorae]|uniref:Secreted protein n=1 Tax=Lineolata rhizophorae TaxID=578093 RepID=A0A6A6P291_9PEZI|nr:hypothetical protein BDY21DRAFT_343138 [Lineolata rhizophorae]
MTDACLFFLSIFFRVSRGFKSFFLFHSLTPGIRRYNTSGVSEAFLGALSVLHHFWLPPFAPWSFSMSLHDHSYHGKVCVLLETTFN